MTARKKKQPPDPRRVRALEAHADALDRVTRTEGKLRRAFRAWDKARQQLARVRKRLERLDEEQLAEAELKKAAGKGPRKHPPAAVVISPDGDVTAGPPPATPEPAVFETGQDPHPKGGQP